MKRFIINWIWKKWGNELYRKFLAELAKQVVDKKSKAVLTDIEFRKDGYYQIGVNYLGNDKCKVISFKL